MGCSADRSLVCFQDFYFSLFFFPLKNNFIPNITVTSCFIMVLRVFCTVSEGLWSILWGVGWDRKHREKLCYLCCSFHCSARSCLKSWQKWALFHIVWVKWGRKKKSPSSCVKGMVKITLRETSRKANHAKTQFAKVSGCFRNNLLRTVIGINFCLYAQLLLEDCRYITMMM